MPVLNLDEELIFEAATDYKNWTFGDVTLKDLPAFDHSASFGITVDDENNNIREEIKKIVHFLNSNELLSSTAMEPLGLPTQLAFKI